MQNSNGISLLCRPHGGEGGEVLVRTVQTSLQKSIGRQSLPKAELETVLTEVEGAIKLNH